MTRVAPDDEEEIQKLKTGDDAVAFFSKAGKSSKSRTFSYLSFPFQAHNLQRFSLSFSPLCCIFFRAMEQLLSNLYISIEQIRIPGSIRETFSRINSLSFLEIKYVEHIWALKWMLCYKRHICFFTFLNPSFHITDQWRIFHNVSDGCGTFSTSSANRIHLSFRLDARIDLVHCLAQHSLLQALSYAQMLSTMVPECTPQTLLQDACQTIPTILPRKDDLLTDNARNTAALSRYATRRFDGFWTVRQQE